MFERILFATDFSEASNDAVDQILRIGGVQEVHVLHVLDKASAVGTGTAPGGRAAFFGDADPETWHQKSTQEADRIAETLASRGLKASSSAEPGDAADVILEAADARNSTAIVMAATGRSRLSEALLGSVSDHVLRRARIPVLIIKR